MTVTLYMNNSEANRMDKNLTVLTTLTGTLREETSIINPEIIIETEAANIGNYLYIDKFRRYYFITDVVSIRNGLWGITCHVDVLMTYREQVRNLSAIIARQENEYNLYLNDDRFLINSPRQYWTKAFPNRVATGGSSLVLTLAGGASSSESSLAD